MIKHYVHWLNMLIYLLNTHNARYLVNDRACALPESWQCSKISRNLFHHFLHRNCYCLKPNIFLETDLFFASLLIKALPTWSASIHVSGKNCMEQGAVDAGLSYIPFCIQSNKCSLQILNKCSLSLPFTQFSSFQQRSDLLSVTYHKIKSSTEDPFHPCWTESLSTAALKYTKE